MKIIALRYNHDGGSGCGQPQVRLMADSSVLTSGKPFFIPDFAQGFTVSATLALRVCRLGKCIARRFAHRYYDAAAAAAVVSARGLTPPVGPDSALATAFDGALWLGDFKPLGQLDGTAVAMELAGTRQAACQCAEPPMTPDEVIELVSRYFTLKMGDIILMGNLSPDEPIAIGDTLTATVGGAPSLRIRVK